VTSFQSTPASHTPGPWHWDSDPMKGDPFNRVRYRVVTTGKTITQCYYSSSDEHAEADARLIAAAPELLDALLAAQRRLEQIDDDCAPAVAVRLQIGAALEKVAR
jgi:hypothetical protein